MAVKSHAIEISDCQLSLIAKALADSRRYEILKRLASNDLGTLCSVMRDCVPVTPATLSHHMKELETAGLVIAEKEGKFVRYLPQRRVLEAYLERLRVDLA